LALAALLTLPPPADGRLHLIADKTIKPKSGKKLPLAHKTRMGLGIAQNVVLSGLK